MRKNEPIKYIMSNNITAMQEGQLLSEVRHKMVDSNIHLLQGIVTSSDLIRYLSNQYLLVVAGVAKWI